MSPCSCRPRGCYKHNVSPVQVAHRLRFSTKSAYQWRRRWRAGGQAALASKVAGGAAFRLTVGRVARLRAALDCGPAAWGWDQDQRWTLARVATLIARLFDVRYTLRGTSYLLKSIEYQPALIDGFLAQTGLTLEPEPP